VVTGRARSHDERSGSRDESGAVLILALVFLVVVSVIVGALTEWTTNDLANSANFTATQTVSNSASNAVNLAVQNIRYDPLLYTSVNNTTTDLTLNASPPDYCWGSGPSQAFNMNVYCTTVWNPTSATTRQVTVTACPISRTAPVTGTASWTAAQSACPQAPFLQAIVTFDDYPQGVSAPSNVQCVVYCGSAMTINDWNWNPVVPKVTGATGLAGTFDGGQPITITGSGFTSGSTVNFVNSDPLAQLQSSPTQQVQQIVPATNVNVNVGTQTITAQSPSVTTLANYYITVTTPGGGSSLVLPGALFVYSSVPPTVTSVTPTSGYTTHGTAITIAGSGFLNGATVTMTQDNGGVANTGNQQPATAVQVVSNSKITAITYPFTTVGQSFFVTVTTSSGGASPYTTSAVFTFTQAPP
jgi:Tfp pilus assembly protein PilX